MRAGPGTFRAGFFLWRWLCWTSGVPGWILAEISVEATYGWRTLARRCSSGIGICLYSTTPRTRRDRELLGHYRGGDHRIARHQRVRGHQKTSREFPQQPRGDEPETEPVPAVSHGLC